MKKSDHFFQYETPENHISNKLNRSEGCKYTLSLHPTYTTLFDRALRTISVPRPARPMQIRTLSKLYRPNTYRQCTYCLGMLTAKAKDPKLATFPTMNKQTPSCQALNFRTGGVSDSSSSSSAERLLWPSFIKFCLTAHSPVSIPHGRHSKQRKLEFKSCLQRCAWSMAVRIMTIVS